MVHKWILDVLTDLRSFAQDNDLQLLADQLAQTTKVASVEIAATTEERSSVTHGVSQHNRALFTGAGAQKGLC